MKRMASFLRRLADEIDPPKRRGRPSRRAAKNAEAVDLLFENGEQMHGWPQEPA